MADWDFVPEVEAVAGPPAPTGTVEFRPNRMALGCSTEMIHEQISMNAKKARLTKLLKRRGEEADGLQSTSQRNGESDSEANESKSLVRRIAMPTSPVNPNQIPPQVLTGSQKKRQKRKLKDQQKKLLS